MTRPTGPWTLPDPWTRGRAHRSLQNRADAVSHTTHRHHPEDQEKNRLKSKT